MTQPDYPSAESPLPGEGRRTSTTDEETAVNRNSDLPADFDAARYEQAKPHFEAALLAFQEAGKTLKDLFGLLIQHFGVGIKPYAVRFAMDKKLTLELGPQDAAEQSGQNPEDYLREAQSQLVGHKMIFMASSGRVTLDRPDPPSVLTEDELEQLVFQLRYCMPLYGIITDLLNWDIQLYDCLGDDWYFLSVFGDASAIEECAEQLAEFFLAKCAEWDMDYNQYEDEDWFEEHVHEQAHEFLLGWRRNVIAKYDSIQNKPISS